MKRRGLMIAVVTLIAVVGGLGLWNMSQSARAAAEEAEGLIEQAEEVVARSRRENLLALAEAEFGTAETAIARAGALLDADAVAAIGAGREALDLAAAARAAALERVPVARAAILEALHHKVLHRAADEVSWRDAERGMSLFDHDRVATKARSEAQISFQKGTVLRLEENSVLVIERLVESKLESSLQMTLSVPEGGIRSTLARVGDRDIRLEINLPRADVVIDTATLEDGRVEIGTRVHDDDTNRVAVYEGSAEVVSKDGERVVLERNQFAEVAIDGSLGAPQELPSATITLLPGRDATVYVSSQRPDVTFKWKSGGVCAGYRLELARDAGFMDKVLDERLRRSRYRFDKLEKGVYLWRMSCLDDKGTGGAYSEVTRFEVVLDDEAPRLSVLAPENNAVVDTDSVEARCESENGAAVFINGEEAASASKGQFGRMVALNPGVNTLVFEAIDEAGNVMYHSRLITRRR